jgi:hypothetical protein
MLAFGSSSPENENEGSDKMYSGTLHGEGVGSHVYVTHGRIQTTDLITATTRLYMITLLLCVL